MISYFTTILPMLRIIVLIFLVSVSFLSSSYISQAQAISSTTSVFRELGIELIEPIADAYYVGDTILIHGRVTDGRQYALIYLKNIVTGESRSELAETTTTGEFSYPLSFHGPEGDYSLIIASGNSFNTSLHYSIRLVANQTIVVPVSSQGIRPVFSSTLPPYLSIGSDIWASMTITQGKKISRTQGKILSFSGLALQYGAARVSLQGYHLTSPSSLDRSTSTGVAWTGSIYIDRTREMIGRDAVSLRVLRSLGTMQFRIPQGKQVKSTYYLTIPDGDVTEGKFAPQYVGTDGYLRTGVTIKQSFVLGNPGVYKIETVASNGYAYFNLPISRSIYYGVIDTLSDLERNTLRPEGSLVTTDIIASINTLRQGLGRSTVSMDPTLQRLAQFKATDMATYSYVGHTTHAGLDIIAFADSQGIDIVGTIGENVAGGNVSDKSLQDGLEESGSHRSNMIDPDWGHVGIGYVLKNGRTYLVQIFGK